MGIGSFSVPLPMRSLVSGITFFSMWNRKFVVPALLAGTLLFAILFGAETSVWGSNIVGTKGDDFLAGAVNEPNTIKGLAGDDQMHGGLMKDKISGSKGDDYAVGSEGPDVLIGGAGHDQLFGGPGNDNIRGDAGDDFISGETGDDVLIGGSGNDSLFGGEGNDKLSGDRGNDYMVGGPGADTFTCGGGADTIVDFNPSEGDTVASDCQS